MALGDEILPLDENVGPLDLGAQIEQTVNPQDQAIIEQAKAPFTPLTPITETPVTAIGAPAQSTLFPGLNQPINVGQQSGQIIGSQPIFVPSGQVLPFGALMEQQREAQVAQQRQDQLAGAAKREQELGKRAQAKAFQFERPKLPTSDDPFFQRSLNEAGNNIINSHIDQAKELFGADWQVALKSDTRVGREFREAMDGVNVLARNANSVVEQFGEVRAGLLSGDVHFSDGVIDSLNDYENLIKDFEGGDINVLANVRPTLEKFQGEIELNTFLQDKAILANVHAQVTGGTGSPEDIGDFLALKTTNRKSYDRNIEAMVKNIRKALGPNSSYTDQDVIDALEGHFQNTATSKTALKTKRAEKGNKIRPEDIRIDKGAKVTKITNPDGETTSDFDAQLSIPIKKGRPFNAIGLSTVDELGNVVKVADAQEITPVEFQLVSSINEDGIRRSRRVLIAKVTEEEPELDRRGKPTGKSVEVEKTKAYDFDENEDRFTTEFGEDVVNEFVNSTVEEERPEGVLDQPDITGFGLREDRTGTQQKALSQFGQDKFNNLSAEQQKRFLEKFK